MKKTLYSLMLSDEVVREIDVLAHRHGTNRSNFINQILAEYVSVTTPERRVNDIFSALEQLMSTSRDIVPFFSPNQMMMSLKSSLEYKYRPTVKYEVQLFRSGEDSLGELSVIFRTQSQTLIRDMTAFFRLWKQIEDLNLPRENGSTGINYALYEGKFVRSISPARNRDYSSRDIAEALNAYITVFDGCMKGFLNGTLSPAEIENRYIEYLKSDSTPV